MSDIVEKMCEAHWNYFAGQDSSATRWQDLGAEGKNDCRIEMRAALTLLTKPENISDSIIQAYSDAIDLGEWNKVPIGDTDMLEMKKAFCAAIQAAIGK